MRWLSISPQSFVASTASYRAAPTVLLHARISVAFIFLVNGFIVASWLPHIPELKERLMLDDSQRRRTFIQTRTFWAWLGPR